MEHVQNPAHTSCVTLGVCLNLSDLFFSSKRHRGIYALESFLGGVNMCVNLSRGLVTPECSPLGRGHYCGE